VADEKIGDAAQATAAEGGVIVLAPNAEAEAAERTGSDDNGSVGTVKKVGTSAVVPASDSYSGSVMEAIERIASRQNQLESDVASLIESQSRYAKSDHAHPNSASVQSLVDALDEMDREEQAPDRRRWWQRRIGGGGN
jgi:hypothetical protein